MNRVQLDEALPTLARYTGLVLTVLLTVALVLGVDYAQVAPGFVPAAGLMLYRTVRNAVRDSEDDNRVEG